MTGDDGMEVLDLDMELDEHALRVFQLHSQPWLKARLQFYKEKSDALWRRPQVEDFRHDTMNSTNRRQPLNAPMNMLR